MLNFIFVVAERSYANVLRTDSKSDDEEASGMATLEAQLRFLSNRVAQIECSTEQRLTDLGRRIQNLTKTVDNLHIHPYCSEPPANCRRTEESQGLKAGDDRYPSQPTRTAAACHYEPCRQRERPMSSSKIGSSYMRSSSNSGHSLDHRDPCTRELCRMPTYSAHEAEKLRMSVQEREKNIQHQNQELKDRRMHLESKIKSMADDVIKAAEYGLPPPFDDPLSPRHSPRLLSPPPKPRSSPPPAPYAIYPKLQLSSSNASHVPSSTTKRSLYTDYGSSSYSHSQPVY